MTSSFTNRSNIPPIDHSGRPERRQAFDDNSEKPQLGEQVANMFSRVAKGARSFLSQNNQ